MGDPLYEAIEDEDEALQLLVELPIAVDRSRFLGFLMGFPRRYLIKTPRVDIVRHFLLMDSLQDHDVLSSLQRQGGAWRLCVVAWDRDYLFSNIVGTLSSQGMDISATEAFANADSKVLDLFEFTDPQRRLPDEARQQSFQGLLKEVLTGRTEVARLFRARTDEIEIPDDQSIRISFDDESHPTGTLVTVDFPDHFGHLYLISRCISDLGARIDMAWVETGEERVHDSFYLSSQGRKLTASMKEDLQERLLKIGESYSLAQKP